MNKTAPSVTYTVQSRDATNSFALSHSSIHRQTINNLWTWYSFVHKILKTSQKKEYPVEKLFIPCPYIEEYDKAKELVLSLDCTV